MSGVLRRGSLNFNCNLNDRGSRGSVDYNLYGGFRDAKPRTPEISVLSLDFRRYSQDLKKEPIKIEVPQQQQQQQPKDLSQDVDSDVISNFTGHYGRWQFVWTLLLSLFQIPSTFHMFSFVFQTADKSFWCAPPAGLADMNVTAWTSLAQPNNACSVVDIAGLNSMNEVTFLGYVAQNAGSMNFTSCTNFAYDTADDDGSSFWSPSSMTLVQEFDLVCDRRSLLSVVEMCFLAGAAVGSVSSGWISDNFGRKHTLMVFAMLQAVFGTILTFSTSLAMYMTLRVIIGFASMTVAVVSFVLVVELVSGKWRTIIGILNILPVAVSYVLTAGIAYFIRDWRTMQIVISLPGWALLCIWYCVPESPRWLLARGRLSELFVLIERAARMNGITLPSNYQKSLEAAAPSPSPAPAPAPAPTPTPSTTTSSAKPPASVETVGHGPERRDTTEAATNTDTTTTASTSTSTYRTKADIEGNSSSPLVVVFSKQYWRTTCLTLIVWLTLIIIYFGLTLHLSNLGGNIYLNTSIAGSVEAVSICLSIFVVLKVGIRRSLIAYMLIPGVCCLAVNLVPMENGDTESFGVIALAMIAKCVIGANNAIIPTYTAMQYPTVVRNFGVGMGNLAAGVGLILVPYMWLLEHVQPLLPMSIMGVSGLIGAVALVMMKDVR